jgi:hypothetical protein
MDACFEPVDFLALAGDGLGIWAEAVFPDRQSNMYHMIHQSVNIAIEDPVMLTP